MGDWMLGEATPLPVASDALGFTKCSLELLTLREISRMVRSEKTRTIRVVRIGEPLRSIMRNHFESARILILVEFD